MKKIYLIFLVSSFFSLIFFSILDSNKKKLVFQNFENNLEKIIEDSIVPKCKNTFNNNLDKSLYKLKELKIIIPRYRNWSKNIINAYTHKSNLIIEKYKKRFNANVLVKNSSNSICKLPARVRISGDFRDHIRMGNGDIISSLDISLREGNIFGITKFKLFLPEARNGDSEVFISLLLKEMGYLSPRTKILMVDFNNQSYKMIFQEKATKEMLENNKLRESAILESDESLMWEIRSKGGSQNNSNIFPRIINDKWTKKSEINQEIGLNGAKIFAKAIVESWNRRGIDSEFSFSDYLLSNGNAKNRKILSRFKAHLLASRGHHALINHNRRFYFDPIKKSLLPIYYDGMSNILDLENNIPLSSDENHKTRDINYEDYNFAINEINAIDLENFHAKLNSSGVNIEKTDLKKVKNKLIKNLIELREKDQLILGNKFENNPLLRKINRDINVNYGLILFSNSNKNFYSCNFKKDKCKKIILNKEELNKLLGGNFLKDETKYFFLGDNFDPFTKNYSKDRPKQYKLLQIDNDIFIEKFGNPEINVDKINKSITIKIKNFEEKILIYNSNIKGWEINVLANKISDLIKSKSRIDKNLLTSLLTIKDSFIENLNIFIDGGQLEDSLNIINSSGTINKINIKNSFQDAIDFDFSNLDVNEVKVTNSGNDCLDTSSGRYFIKNLNLDVCRDKGVSVGEESYVELGFVQIKDSKIGLVSKDSSKLIVKKAILKNNKLCVAAYNKKQEFGPSYISIPNYLCDNKKLAIQNLSILEVK